MSAFITGTGLFVPEHVITNDELVSSYNCYVEQYNSEYSDEIKSGKREELKESSVEFIEKASGIRKRHVVDKDGVLDSRRMKPRIPGRENHEMSLQCEMAVAAASQALDNARLGGEDLDMIIVACSNLERAYPAVSIEVQERLCASGFALDMNVACSSATFAIQAASDALNNGSAQRVLVVNPEICSAHLDFRDRDSHFIFGDICTAIVLESDESRKDSDVFEVVSTRLRTKFSSNIRNNFGFLNRCDDNLENRKDTLFIQEGRKVFKEVVPLVSNHILEHLYQIELAPERVRRLWLHQANLSMNQLVAKRVWGRPANADEAPVVLDHYANTSSAGSIIAFHRYNKDLSDGELGLLCSFGAGYSVGSVVLRKINSTL